MAPSTPWADQPYPLIQTPAFKSQKLIKNEAMATDMAIAHNAYIRCLNSIYLQAEGVTKEQDIKDFLFYCQAWYDTLHHHHTLEEEAVFPGIEKAVGVEGIMQANVDQHHAFHDGLEAFEKYISTTSPSDYSGAKLKEIIDSFGKILVEHLHDEIPTLLALKQYDPDGSLKKIYDSAVEGAIEKAEIRKDFPWILANHDKTYENNIFPWPPVPFFVPYIVKYVFSRKYAGSWRFCSCDYFGQPQPLKFLPKSE